MYQTDPQLGKNIQQLLTHLKIENPANFILTRQWQESNKLFQLEEKFVSFLADTGIYAHQEEIKRTATRIINFWCNEQFYGLNYSNFPAISLSSNEFGYHEPLIAEAIKFTTTCEHHLVPIHGVATIAYAPKNYVIGLNKLNCVLEFFAHRPQLQERLTRQVFVTLQHILQTDDIAVIIKAQHDCMSTNGICDRDTKHTTLETGGIYATDQTLKKHLLDSLR